MKKRSNTLLAIYFPAVLLIFLLICTGVPSGVVLASDGEILAEAAEAVPDEVTVLEVEETVPEEVTVPEMEEPVPEEVTVLEVEETVPEVEEAVLEMEEAVPKEVAVLEEVAVPEMKAAVPKEVAVLEEVAVPEMKAPAAVEVVAPEEVTVPETEVVVPEETGILKETPDYAVMSVFTNTAAPGGTEAFVERLYQTALNRRSDPQGLRNWTNALNSGSLTAADVVLSFFGSPEYQGKNKTNSAIVTDFYASMLGRTPDSGGHAHWQEFLDTGMTYYAIARGFTGSVEFQSLCHQYGVTAGSVTSPYARDINYDRTAFVGRLYTNCLGRNYDVNGLEDWCAEIERSATASRVASGFVFSEEYRNKNTSDDAFTEMMYQTMLGRASDSQGKASWVEHLDSGAPREKIFNGFLYSQEFMKQCEVAAIPVGDPIPEPETLPLRGIDVSRWQGNIDWNAVKNSGIKFAILRAGARGYGTGALVTDATFRNNLNAAQAAGIRVGAYVYSSAVNEAEAAEEAALALNILQGSKLQLPVFIDMESPAGGRAENVSYSTRTSVVHTFCREVLRAGYQAGVYANKTWFDSYMDTPSFHNYTIWLAHWTSGGKASDYSRTRYDIWQYTSKGSVPGINGDVDMNLAYRWF